MTSTSDNSNARVKQSFNSQIEKEIQLKRQKLAEIRKNSFILSNPDNLEPEDILFEKEVQKMIQQSNERERLKKAAQTKDLLNPQFWKYFISKNIDYFSMTLMDANVLLLTYPFLTVKTRVQANHISEDVSHFMKNHVKDQSLYQGISQAILSVVLGNTLTINGFRYYQLNYAKGNYNYEKTPTALFKDTLLGHAFGDIISLPCRIFFDAKRQFLQLNYPAYTFKDVAKAMKIGFIPCLLRDAIFRVAFSSINHLVLYSRFYQSYYTSPQSTVPLPEYEAKITSNQRVGTMLLSTFLAALISNPFDVVAVKVMTQRTDKYKSFIDCFKLVIQEEKPSKLWFSGLSSRMAFFSINAYIALNYYPQFRQMFEEAYSF